MRLHALGVEKGQRAREMGAETTIAALTAAGSGMEEVERNKAAAELKAAARRAVSIAAELKDCRLFLSNENLRVLSEWGQHPYADFRFSVSLLPPEQGGHRRFEFRGKPYFQHRLPPEFWGEIVEARFDAEQPHA